MKLEVVIPIRDKDVELLDNCLDSIQSCDGDFELHVVDLGSDDCDRYEELCKGRCKYHYLTYEEWNKPLALNYRLKQTEADWFGMLDGDYLVEEEFFTKIISNMEEWSLIQCRGVEMGDEFSEIEKLDDHFSFCDAMVAYGMEPRPKADFGGFQAFPAQIGKLIHGYDERFKWYGGMHHEMRERLLNCGLQEKRLHGDPLLFHQTHPNWVKGKNKERKREIKKERQRHRNIIMELQQGGRVQANQEYKWGDHG